MLCAAAPSAAAIAHVQTVSCTSSAAASCTTGAVTTTSGNLFVASVSWGFVGSTTFTSVSDNKSNTYTNSIAETVDDGGSGVAAIRQEYKANGNGGAGHTFTGTLGAGYFITISVSEISGADTSSPLDKTAVGSDTLVTNHTTASTSTTAQANEYITGVGGAAGVPSVNINFTCGGSFTERTNIAAVDSSIEGIIACSKIVAATSTYAFDFTTDITARTASGISTWKEAGAGGATRQKCIGCGVDKKVIGQ